MYLSKGCLVKRLPQVKWKADQHLVRTNNIGHHKALPIRRPMCNHSTIVLVGTVHKTMNPTRHVHKPSRFDKRPRLNLTANQGAIRSPFLQAVVRHKGAHPKNERFSDGNAETTQTNSRRKGDQVKIKTVAKKQEKRWQSGFQKKNRQRQRRNGTRRDNERTIAGLRVAKLLFHSDCGPASGPRETLLKGQLPQELLDNFAVSGSTPKH